MSSTNSEPGSNLQQCYENYVLIDVGANLINKKFSRDLDSVIKRAKDAGKDCKLLSHLLFVAH